MQIGLEIQMIEDQLEAIYSSLETHLLHGIVASSPQCHSVLVKLNTEACAMPQKKRYGLGD